MFGKQRISKFKEITEPNSKNPFNSKLPESLETMYHMSIIIQMLVYMSSLINSVNIQGVPEKTLRQLFGFHVVK